jgi:hypothetical protein
LTRRELRKYTLPRKLARLFWNRVKWFIPFLRSRLVSDLKQQSIFRSSKSWYTFYNSGPRDFIEWKDKDKKLVQGVRYVSLHVGDVIEEKGQHACQDKSWNVKYVSSDKLPTGQAVFVAKVSLVKEQEPESALESCEATECSTKLR